MKKYEVVQYMNGGYEEEVVEVFEKFEDANLYCRMHDNMECPEEEGMFIKCYENGKVWREEWE